MSSKNARRVLLYSLPVTETAVTLRKLLADASPPFAGEPVQINIRCNGNILQVQDGHTGNAHSIPQEEEVIYPASNVLDSLSVLLPSGAGTDTFSLTIYTDQED